MSELHLGDITVDVVRKPIKHMHLSVYPPTGRVRIAAPYHLTTDTIRVFALSKLGWIKQQQRKLQEQIRDTPRDYIERESHYLWGNRYLLTIVEAEQAPTVVLQHHHIQLIVRPGTDTARREAILNTWYRSQLRAALPPLLDRWQSILGVQVARVFVQQMKTRWGSCTPATRSIRLNTELAKKPAQCLEYILVHELAHLVEPTHNRRFTAILNHVMPHWQAYRAELNQLPVRHETWTY